MAAALPGTYWLRELALFQPGEEKSLGRPHYSYITIHNTEYSSFASEQLLLADCVLCRGVGLEPPEVPYNLSHSAIL